MRKNTVKNKRMFLAVGLAIVAFVGIQYAKISVEPIELIFSHDLHVGEMGMECETCHKGVTESKSGSDDMLPVMDDCGECHDVSDNCAMCHSTPDDPQPLPKITNVVSKFNHSAHISKDISCETCHEGVSVSKEASSRHMPDIVVCMDMDACMNCHDGIQADKSCSVCHEHPDGPLPADHIFPAWKKQHGDQARMDNAEACMMCHERNSCQECHQGDNLWPRVHSLGYEYRHGVDVRSNRMECASCHEDRSFCIACHEERQVYPRSHQRSNWAHTGVGGGRHSVEARMNIETCASCHGDEPGAQPVCVQCHGN